MGAAGQAVQDADAKRRVSVPMRSRSVVRSFVSMNVNMDVAFAAVFMFVSVELIFESFLQSPESDSQQHYADKSFAPGRKQIDRQQIPQP